MALADALHTLLRLPGATYSCVVERDSGRVLAELGRGEAGAGDSEGVVPYSVPRWGTAVAAMFDSTSGDELDDVMITGRRSYHLVRPLGAGAEVLVYLRLDRSRSNLAAARRELAAVRLSAGPVARPAAPPAESPARPAEPPARTAGPGRRRASPGSSSRAAGPAVPPARTPASLAPPATPARGLRGTTAPSPGPSSGSSTSGSSTSGSAPSAPPAPARAGDDAVPARQIPLPRRAPGRSPTDAGPVRSAGRRGGVATVPEPVPEGFAVPAVLGQTWARDPGTLRRLLAGLRRMS